MPYLWEFSLLFWYNESIKTKAVFPMMTQNADKKRKQIRCSAWMTLFRRIICCA